MLLEDFRQQGAAIVLATSYMDEAERCDRVLFLHEGRALALGAPAELKAQVAGSVFEVETTEVTALEEQLAAEARVRAFARLPGKIRFQLEQPATDPLPLLQQVQNVRPVTPQLDDLFALVAPAGASAKIIAMPLTRERPASDGTSVATTVRAQNVTCRFGDFTAVNDVSLELKAGEVFGFLGPNGAGKTTLIRILCGLQSFQSGDVEVAGVDVHREAKRLRSRIGYMSQRFSLYPDLTVMENLEFFAGVYALTAAARARALTWAVETAGLQGLAHRKVNEISGAVRQRLALACSVMHRPQVLFLDEPTSGVDPLSRHRFWRLVHALAEEGITAFVTTHYMEEAAYCHRLGLMFQGRLVALGPMGELRAREQLPETTQVEALFLHYIERARQAA
jgi:ABC-2 type transport system ATP-binding protein